MEIELVQIPIRDIVNGYVNNDEEGVVGFGGRLNIRPKYQRNFVYDIDDSRAVINTIDCNFPLNIMYWVISEGEYKIEEQKDHTKKLIVSDDAKFELLDGQQRTVSFCQYCTKRLSYELTDKHGNPNYFINRTQEQKDRFLDYKVMVYICKGTDEEKLAWFEVINIAGKPLTPQELKNAIYSGPWVVEAKKYFSKTNPPCAASQIAEKYHNKTINRQELLELALKWIADRDTRNGLKTSIADYMARHKYDTNANDLWLYFEAVMSWTKATFNPYIKEMETVDWGILYNKYKDKVPDDIDAKYKKLLSMKDEIGNVKGIFEALLSGDLKYISARTFNKADINRKYIEQGGVCPYCKEHFDKDQMHGDHIRPWSKGGKTEYTNLQLLCSACNLKKSAYDVKYEPWDTSIYEDFDIKKWDENTK